MGNSRAESVRNGLIAIAARTNDDDRVLVHDAARPCLTEGQLGRLIDEVGSDDGGGLLAVPLADTLKRGEDGRVGITLELTGLWCAQTPQLFRVASLRAALSQGSLDAITDDASAMERTGHAPPLVLGGAGNLKVTTAEEWWKQRRPEIVEDFDREVYGRVPRNVPNVTWEVTGTTDGMNGDVPILTKRLLGHVDNSSCPLITVDIQLSLTTPADLTAPVPVMMKSQTRSAS